MSDSSALQALETRGFVVLEGLLDAPQLSRAREQLEPLLEVGPAGRNHFEGTKTQRVYSVVAYDEIFGEMVLHPRVLAIVDALLEPNYLLTASQAIVIHPGETPQPVHYDDGFYGLARPRPPVSISTIWALDDFTAANGGTEIIAGSHRWDDAQTEAAKLVDLHNDPGARGARIDAELGPLEMKAGSCVVFAGTMLHRGGANRSQMRRRAVSHQYCQPWARQQENFMLSIPRARAAAMPPRLQGMLGYSIHPPFMGHVAGRTPTKLLDPQWRNPLETDNS
ncbi:MAG: phytanoyl-CoA dioxygenase family protein [Myxococcota bacterium]